MKLSEINISFMFVVGCLFLLVFCVGLGIILNEILLFMVLFLVAIVLFILIELLGNFVSEFLIEQGVVT